MFRNAFRPGDPVPEGKTYWVNHYRHRLAHLAKVQMARFPECAQCGERVRFEPAPLQRDGSVPLLRYDRDFLTAARRNRLEPDFGTGT